MRSIHEMKKGDYVKVRGRLEKIESVWGVDSGGGLAKPSEGGFGVVTESGEKVDMWHADSYLKAEDVQD